MSIRPVSDSEPVPEPGRRIIIERPPVIIDGVVDYNRDEDGTLYLFGPRAMPAGDFGPGTYQAVYYEAVKPSPDPLAQAG